jgi:hypothetical protein
MLAVTSFNRLKGVRNLDEVVIHDFRAFCLNLAFILDCSKTSQRLTEFPNEQ